MENNVAVAPAAAPKELSALENAVKLLENSTEPADMKNALTTILAQVEKSTTKREAENWRRPSRTAGDKADAVDDKDDDRNADKKVYVTCKSQHVLNRFQTPHAGYTCDICSKTQKLNATVFGCRLCNWDACVACQGKLLSKLRDEAQSVQGPQPVQTEATAKISFPPNTVSGLINCFGVCGNDAEICVMLLKVSRDFSADSLNRPITLRNCVGSTVGAYKENLEIVRAGFSALHNLMTIQDKVTVEEIEALLQVSTEALDMHKGDELAAAKVLGFLLALHDVNETARTLVNQAKQENNVLDILKRFYKNAEIAERACGLLARLSSSLIPSEVAPTLENVLKTHAASDAVVEQVYQVILACGASDPAALVQQVERMSRFRFDA